MAKRLETASGSGRKVSASSSERNAESVAFPALLDFARRLEALRVQRGISQRALAARAAISTNHYQEIAHAQANPSVLVLLRLANALRVSLAELFESETTADDVQRLVPAADLRELASLHRQLRDIVTRLTRYDAS